MRTSTKHLLSTGRSGVTSAFFVAAALIFLLSGCAGPAYILHYRLTLVFEVDGVLKSGSSIVEVTYTDISKGLAPGFPWNFGLRGEATVVDLGSHGLLFCLLTSDPTRSGSVYQTVASLPLLFFPSYGLGLDAGEKGAAHLRALISDEPTANIDPKLLPMLVRFRDINVPSSVERVDPLDLRKSLGDGVKFVHATIAITDERVTSGIELKLPWLKALAKQRATLDGDKSVARNFDAPLSNTLGPGNFKIGDYK